MTYNRNYKNKFVARQKDKQEKKLSTRNFLKKNTRLVNHGSPRMIED